MTKKTKLPRLYPIIDVDSFRHETNLPAALFQFAQHLLEGGATLIQYRNKNGTAGQMISHLRELRRAVGTRAMLIVNDRADVALAAGCDGVHLGQQDLSVEGARRVVGNIAIVGISTHDLQQVIDAEKTSADYIAVGPVFATVSKTDAEPVVGLELVRVARKATGKPLVAIGGITRTNFRSVIEAGADSVAVIGDLRDSPQKAVEEFLRMLA
jgi:thiamine-phosphate pyrophosphorylase